MRKFGTKPKPKRFTPPKATRGGYVGFFQTKPETPLTGEVQGQKAAKGEERFARTIEKGISKGLVQKHYFRWTTLKRGTPGYKELDELIYTPHEILAVSIKGEEFVHRSEADKNQDKINELIILAQLKRYGIDVPRITSIAAESLATQEQADKAGKDLGIWR